MCALDSVIRAELCALLGKAKKVSKPHIDQVASIAKPHVDKVHGALEPYLKEVVYAYGKFLKYATAYHHEIAGMADSFIPISADHSEPSVGGPSLDPRPVAPPVLAILPPPVLQPIPLQAIPPSGVRPPIRGPPPADSGFTGHSVTERLGVVRGDSELQVFRRAAAVRIAEDTHEDITPDFLMEWASEKMPPRRNTCTNTQNEETNNNNQDNTNQNAKSGPIDPAVAQILQILAQQTVHLTQQQQRQTSPQMEQCEFGLISEGKESVSVRFGTRRSPAKTTGNWV
ncbi:hypothetical protein AgCh_001230 [Apium graveolens]